MVIEWVTVIINAIVTLLAVGGLGWIFTIREDKKAKKLENKQKEAEIDEYKKDEIIKDWKDIADERKLRADELSTELKEKERQTIEKDATISELRTKLDARNTYCAVSELLKCNDIQCVNRKPPFASSIVTTEAAVANFVNNIGEN